MKFSFLAFLADLFSKFCLQNFEDVSIKCPRQFSYDLAFVCRRTCEKKLNMNFMSFKIWNWNKYRKYTVWQVLEQFSGRNNSLELPGFGFSISLLNFLEESRELSTLISWILGYLAFSKLQQNFFCHQCFLHFWATIMDLLITLKFAFSNMISRGLSTY